MKKLIIILFISIAGYCSAQNINVPTRKAVFDSSAIERTRQEKFFGEVGNKLTAAEFSNWYTTKNYDVLTKKALDDFARQYYTFINEKYAEWLRTQKPK